LQQPDLVDINEAVRVTGLHAQTIYRLAREQRIRSFRILRHRVRFERSDLTALVSERTVKATQPGPTDNVA
jgi:excisionase family DNA binding protein